MFWGVFTPFHNHHRKHVICGGATEYKPGRKRGERPSTFFRTQQVGAETTYSLEEVRALQPRTTLYPEGSALLPGRGRGHNTNSGGKWVDGLSIGKQAAPLAHACDVCVVRVWGARACGAEGTCGEWNGCQRVGPDTALRGVSGGRGLRRRAEGGVANGPSPSGLAKRRASCTLPPAASTHVLLRAHPATAPEETLGRPPQYPQEVRVPEAGAATCSGPLEGKGGVRGFCP
jgi:hypothetical protein